MKRILIITTGGTIASVKTEHGLIPALSSEELLSFLPKFDVEVSLDTKEVCSIDSSDMTPDIWLLIAKTIENNYTNYDGFVVCHGTDTLAYTAGALSYLIQNSRKPIILTGAQKPIDSEITDAKINLQNSIILAADEKSQGVSVVFDGKVIVGTRAKKIKTYSFAAFDSVNYPVLAVLRNQKVIRFVEPILYSEDVIFYHSLNTKVFLLKLVPGMSSEIIKTIFEYNDCIIIESFGVGGIPEYLLNEILKYSTKDKIVIITTQVSYEGSNLGVYEVGNRVVGMTNIIEAKDMTLEAIYTKLMWILALDDLDSKKISSLISKRINDDTLL